MYHWTSIPTASVTLLLSVPQATSEVSSVAN